MTGPGRPPRARVPEYRGYTGPNGRGTARACIGHPRPGPEPDLILYPLIDLLARLILGDDWRDQT